MLITPQHHQQFLAHKLFLYPNVNILGRGKLSQYVKINPGCTIISVSIKAFTYSSSSLQFCEVGSYCSIAAHLHFVGNHNIHRLTTSPCTNVSENDDIFGNFLNRTPIDRSHLIGGLTIGNDVWIGQNVTLLPGIHIGNGAIIGTGAVVTRDVPDFSISCGVPAKTKKMRFDDKIIEKIYQLKWYDYDWSNIPITWVNPEQTLA